MTLPWRKYLECSSSHCSLRHPCVLTHFVIPVSSLPWRKYLECSSSHCSLRHPCVLTHFVIPVSSLPWRKYLECSSSHCSLRHPCVLTHMTCLLTHLIVIPDFSLTLLVLPLIPYSVFPHAPTLIVLTQVISSSSLATHSHDL